MQKTVNTNQITKDENAENSTTSNPDEHEDKDESTASEQQETNPEECRNEDTDMTVDHAMLTVSMATAISGATLQNRPLFEHFANLYQEHIPESFVLPLPVMTLISSGKFAPGKQNLIKELLVLPQAGNTIKQGIEQLTNIYHELGKVLPSKVGISGGLKYREGGYSPVLDKPEIALECVQEAIEAAGYQLGENTNIIIDCAADEIFDQDKQKYEVMANTFKTGDDLINMYSEFAERFPGLLAIIDGIHSKDEDMWVKLSQKLGESCFITANNFIHINPTLVSNGVDNKLFSMAKFSLASSSTVSGTVNKCQNIKEQGGFVMLEDAPGNNTSLIVDLAVGTGVRFLKIGAASGLQQISKYNRLLDIAAQLQHEERVSPQDRHVFPVIFEPEPEVDLPENQQGDSQETA